MSLQHIACTALKWVLLFHSSGVRVHAPIHSVSQTIRSGQTAKSPRHAHAASGAPPNSSADGSACVQLGAFGAHQLLGLVPLTTNCWQEAPGGGRVVGVLGHVLTQGSIGVPDCMVSVLLFYPPPKVTKSVSGGNGCETRGCYQVCDQ